MEPLYYEVVHLSGAGETWLFATQQAAQDFVRSRICDDCRQILDNGGSADFNPVTQDYEMTLIRNPLETDCGGEYTIHEVTREQYQQRVSGALEEALRELDQMTQMWESDYHNGDGITASEGAD